MTAPLSIGINQAPAGPPTTINAPPVRTPKPKRPMGRPTVMTPAVIQKLEDAFMNAFTDEMACLYAGISEAALYDYGVENPKFRERKERLKVTPNMAAQKKLVDDAAATISGARFWAEHRMPEFMPKTKVEHGGKIETVDGTVSDAAKKVKDEYEEKLRQTIAGEAGKKA